MKSYKSFHARLVWILFIQYFLFTTLAFSVETTDCKDASGNVVTLAFGSLCATATGGFGNIAPYGNLDGELNISDAVVALRISMGLIASLDPTYKSKADIAPLCIKGNASCSKTGDGNVDISDAVVILRLALGLVDPTTVVWGGTTLNSYTNRLGMTFNLIPAGTFMQGTPSGEAGRQLDEGPQRSVTISEAFYLQTTEITQGQWKAVMGKNPSYFSTCGDNCPVEQVSWDDLQIFITTMNSRKEGTYRLPTEAEWEYAARAGTTTAYSFGASSSPLGNYAWYKDNAAAKTHPVATKLPNPWGLYDMHGNVWEWVQDWYGDYPSDAEIDPQGPSTGSDRVDRGGGWANTPNFVRSAIRDAIPPDYLDLYLGARLLKVP